MNAEKHDRKIIESILAQALITSSSQARGSVLKPGNSRPLSYFIPYIKVLCGMKLKDQDTIYYTALKALEDDAEYARPAEEEEDQAAENIVCRLSPRYIKRLLRKIKNASTGCLDSVIEKCIYYAYEHFDKRDDKLRAKYFGGFDVQYIVHVDDERLSMTQRRLLLLYGMCNGDKIENYGSDIETVQIFRETDFEISSEYMKQALIDNAKTADEKFLKDLWMTKDIIFDSLYEMHQIKFFLGTIYPILISRFADWDIRIMRFENYNYVEFYISKHGKIKKNRTKIALLDESGGKKDEIIISSITYKLFQHIPQRFISKNLTKLAGYFVS